MPRLGVWLPAALLRRPRLAAVALAVGAIFSQQRARLQRRLQRGVTGAHVDAGPGLPDGDPERLFAKFQRGREQGNTGGAGLGLAICRAIVIAHGGTIQAGLRPGGGARFRFTLPATEAPS